MKNKTLANDYITRAGARLAATETLMKLNSYADVVRESQELIELCLKGMLRLSNIEVPRLHDVSDILLDSASRLPKDIQTQVEKIAKISRRLRRDRELSFYGTEDLTPSEFYKEADAKEALDDAKWIFSLCEKLLNGIK